MASSKSIRRRTNQLTKNLKLDLFVMTKQEVHSLTDKEPDFMSCMNMFLSGNNSFIYMFDNFRDQALQHLVGYFLPHGISQPSWWPTKSLKWCAQLGFPVHKVEPPFELDASKLPKLWKIAVLVGIIEHHSPSVICHAVRLAERLKAMMSDKEKYILSAALTILYEKFSNNADTGPFRVMEETCREYVVLGLAAPPRQQQTNINKRSRESRKVKNVMRAKGEKALTVSGGMNSGSSSSILILSQAAEVSIKDMIPMNAPAGGTKEAAEVSIKDMIPTNAPAEGTKEAAEVSIKDMIPTNAPAGGTKEAAEVSIKDMIPTNAPEEGETEEIIDVPAGQTLIPEDASENKKEECSTLISPDEGEKAEFYNLDKNYVSDKSISESHSTGKEVEECSKDKMKGINNACESESRILEDEGENKNSTTPSNEFPPLSIDDYQVDELPISHEAPQTDDEFINSIFNFKHEP